MVMTGKDRNNAGRDLRDLPDDSFQSTKFVERQLSNHGGHKTKLVSFEDALELIMVLPGKVARDTRCNFKGIIHRFMAGDKSLLVEVENNAESTSPLAQLARASLPEQAQEDAETRRKRMRREDLELLKLEQEVQEKRIKNFHDSIAHLAQIRPDWMQTDARFRLQTEDVIKNIIMSPPGQAAPALTNGEQAPIASLSISQLAQELGRKRLHHADACRAGALAAKRYRALHGEDPSKHRQWVDGAERVVNSYTEADRGLLTAVLRDLCLVPSSQGSSCSSVTGE